ncbi:hypothetical protein ABPG73_007767, partial [Tetrahymena malaccensis]
MQQCPIGCSSACPNGKCTACLPGYDLIQNKCILKCGMGLFLKTDPNSSQQSCVSCMQNCDNCSDANSCDTCKNNFVYMKINNINECVPKCTLPAQYLDSQGSCQNCILNCSSCSQANSCDVCAPQYIKTQSNTCQCSGYFSNNQCLPCYSSCLTCSDGQSKNCQSCQNGYYPVLNSLNQTPFECLQVCPNNFQLVNNKCQICDTTNYKSCFNCPSTCRTCSSSQSTVCIDCFDGMQLNPDGKCSSLKDQRNFDFYFRSNNDIAVVNAIFSSQTPTLTLEFGINLISTVVLCNQIFDSSTSSLLGASSCSISTSQVIVSLSQDAKIMVTDTINIINTAKVLQFKDSQQPIMNIYLLSVSQEPAIGEVLLKYNQVVNYCNDVTFQIQTINKDAGRGFLNFKWVLDQIQNYDQSTIDNLNTIMQTANTQQQQTLVIPKQTFPPDINIAIKLSYTFKTNFSGQSSASSYVQSTKQIFVSAIQSLYPPLYRYADLEVKFIFFTQECGKSGSSSVQDIYDIQITSQLLPSLNQHFTQYKSQILELDIPPYSVLSANTNLDIQLQIYITKNQGLSTTYNLSIPYSLSNLQLFIQNGVEQLVDYKRNLNLIGVARDFEVLDPNAPQGIQLKWSYLENENENQSILSLYVNQKQEKETEQINQQVKVDKESQDAKPSSIEIQTQQKIEENKKIVNKLKESKNTKKLQESSIFKKILIFHSFSSIFFVYSNQQSRAFRFSLFYLRVIHSMSISIIFDQQYNQEQILIISGINSVVIIVSAAIIQLLYKQRKIDSMVYLTTQQFDCPTTLQQTKPPNALGYKCMVASKTNFNSDFLFNVPRFQYYLQNAQTQMLPSAIQSRQPNCPNIVQASSDAIQISIDYSFSSQYLESVYVSFDLIYQGSADSFQIISQWNKVYFKGVYQKSDFPSITNDGCGYNLSKFVVKMNMPSDVLNANAVAISFQLFNGNNYRTVSISDFEILFYYKCPVGCAQSCANGQCSDCLSGYSLVSGQCVLQCTQGLFLKIDPNSTQQSCVSCIQNCDKCSDANSCDTCKSGFVYMKINNANQCVALCTQPAQYIDSQGVCQNCIQNCDKCSDANSCDTCKSGFVYMKINNANQCVAQCTQPAQYIDSQGVCQNCVQNCTSCSQANTCDTCAPQFVKNQQGTCDCLGYISNSQCLPCYSSCQTCSDGQKTSCKSCQNGYYPVLNPLSQTLFECLQACPNNYLFVNNQCKQCDTTNYKSCFNCPSTCRTCSSSQSTVCIDCFDGMQLNQNGKCSSLSDQRNLDFYFRSYNDIAVVSAVFSSQTPTLTFEFGLNIISPSVQCNQIFDDSTLGLLKASTCSISTSKIIVSLSQDATIMVTSTINIINTAQILKFVNQQPINNIYLLSVVQEPVSGQVILQYDQVTSYCNDVTFQIKAINNDAGRGFLNFQWVLDQIQNYDQSTIQNLNIIIQAANSQQQQTLVIPKQIFPPDINIAIILTYTFKTNFKGQTSASTFVQSVKQISVSAIQNLYPPVYRYVDLQVKFLFFTQECGKSGTNAVQDIYDIQITSQLLPSLNKHFPQYKSQVLNFDIPPYSVLTANANLDIQLQISIAKNQALSTTYSMSIPYSLSNLQLFIQNGV